MRIACPSRLLIQCVLLLLGLSLVWSGNAGEPGPVIPKGKGDRCVAETDFMRRNHMDLIVHQRDETVIRGIRDEPFSLVECVDCHAQQNENNEPVRIDAEGQFCSSCHSYIAVKIDCFGCHAAVPDTEKLGSFDSQHGLSHEQMLAFMQTQDRSSNAARNKSTNLPVYSELKTLLNPALERDRHELNNIRPE